MKRSTDRLNQATQSDLAEQIKADGDEVMVDKVKQISAFIYAEKIYLTEAEARAVECKDKLCAYANEHLNWVITEQALEAFEDVNFINLIRSWCAAQSEVNQAKKDGL